MEKIILEHFQNRKQEKETIPKNIPVIVSHTVVHKFFLEVYSLTIFTFRFFKEVFVPPYELNELLKQSFLIGYKSLPLVAVTSFIIGLVLTVQSRPTLEKFGAESLLPMMVAISIIREI